MSERTQTRIKIIISSILGAFLIYCGQSVRNNGDVTVLDDQNGTIPDARAQDGTCTKDCQPQFTVVFDGVLGQSGETEVLDATRFTHVVVYRESESTNCIQLLWRGNENTDFGHVNPNVTGMVPVYGRQLRVRNGCGDRTLNLSVAGVR